METELSTVGPMVLIGLEGPPGARVRHAA